jgi:hypothetical protein
MNLYDIIYLKNKVQIINKFILTIQYIGMADGE